MAQLQIRQLSNSGELLKCVNCFAGQVTVLRAHTEQDLTPFQRALSGRPGPERFSIVLDNDAFKPEAEVLIGFGEQLPKGIKVADYCERAGIPSGSIASLLLNYGLDGQESRSCEDLSECQARRIQIIAAIYSAAKVWVLNNPFDPISSAWRERFAELILNDTRTKQRITVVAGLSFRPQSWIGNEFINRVQVGETLQKTVGFGSQGNEVNDMVKQLRDILKNEDAVQQFLKSQGKSAPTAEPAAHPTQPPQTPPSVGITASSAFGKPTSGAYSGTFESSSQGKIQEWDSTPQKEAKTFKSIAAQNNAGNSFASDKRLLVGVGALTAILVVAVAYIYLGNSTPKNLSVAKVEKIESNAKVENSTPTKSKTEISQQKLDKGVVVANNDHASSQKVKELLSNLTPASPAPSRSSTPLVTEPPIEIAKAMYVLDSYPDPIKNAVLKAFSSKAVLSNINVAPKEVTPKIPSLKSVETQKNPFEELRGLKPSTEPENPTFANNQNTYAQQANLEGTDETMEERQARVRQKFMEAINRAIEKREQGGNAE